MVMVVMPARRRRWRRRRLTVESAMMSAVASGMMDRCGAVSAAMPAGAGSGTGVCACCHCESAHEGDEKFLVVHITPDFLF